MPHPLLPVTEKNTMLIQAAWLHIITVLQDPTAEDTIHSACTT